MQKRVTTEKKEERSQLASKLVSGLPDGCLTDFSTPRPCYCRSFSLSILSSFLPSLFLFCLALFEGLLLAWPGLTLRWSVVSVRRYVCLSSSTLHLFCDWHHLSSGSSISKSNSSSCSREIFTLLYKFIFLLSFFLCYHGIILLALVAISSITQVFCFRILHAYTYTHHQLY